MLLYPPIQVSGCVWTVFVILVSCSRCSSVWYCLVLPMPRAMGYNSQRIYVPVKCITWLHNLFLLALLLSKICMCSITFQYVLYNKASPCAHTCICFYSHSAYITLSLPSHDSTLTAALGALPWRCLCYYWMVNWLKSMEEALAHSVPLFHVGV